MKARLLLAVLAGVMVPADMLAADYSIDRYTIGSGGVSKGGIYEVAGSIDTTGGTRFNGGAYDVLGGFWTALMAIQTPGAPEVAIGQAGDNFTITWDTQITGYVLEETSSLTPPISWQPASGVSNNSLTVNMTIGIKFYRLRKL
jgi:hypothetical protein